MGILTYLEKMEYCTVSADYRKRITEWLDWYQGQVTKFHKYMVFNGKSRIGQTRATMGMAKKVSEEWANLILNERVTINTENDDFAKTLDKVMAFNNFRVRGNQLIELAFALGTGAFVEYLDAAGNVSIDYIRANMIFPLSWENGEITECAFASEKVTGKRTCSYINLHVLKDGKYTIINKMIDNKDDSEVELPEGLLPEIATGSSLPRFQIIQPNVINNVDLDCPMGISIYGNAIDNLKHCDLVFDSYNGEFRLGKKRIIVPLSMAKVEMEKAGVTSPAFDDNDTEFYALDLGKDAKNEIIEINMELRADAHEKGLQTALNLLSDKCGLGAGRFEYQAASGVKTATEIISENGPLYQSLKKHELIVERALIDMVKTIAAMSGLTEELTVTINFDDSIIQDTDSIRQSAMLEFNSGLIDEVKYHMRVYNLTEAAAIKEVAAMKGRAPAKPEVVDFNPDTDGDAE